MKVLIDCGGSSVKIKRYENGEFSRTHRFHPTSIEKFYQCIENMVEKDDQSSAGCGVTGIAISLCGEYDYVKDKVLTCWAYPFLVGNLKANLKERFGCKNIHIVNDGDAHALALKRQYIEEGREASSAINLSLGTSVGFGILDWEGNLLHTCQGHNWEVGHWQCDTKARFKEQYWALGSQGLKSLEEEYGKPTAYYLYGQRLCHFLGRDLVPIFHPKIIGLSGGIAAAHFKEIEEGIRQECASRGYSKPGGRLYGVDVFVSPEKDFVMRGLANILDEDEPSIISQIDETVKSVGKQFGELLRKLVLSDAGFSGSQGDYNENDDGNLDWEEDIPVDCLCALYAVHAGLTVCAENGGGSPLVANRQRPQGAWEEFTLLQNNDGSYSLKSHANGLFVSARPDGRLIAAGAKVDAWELFDLEKVSGKSDVFTLWSRNTRKYVSVDESEGNVLIANRESADTWEEFRIVRVER